MAVAERYVNAGKKWLGTESDIDARRTSCDNSEKEVLTWLREGFRQKSHTILRPERELPDSIGFRGWWKTCVSNRMIPPLALYSVWSKQHRMGSQSHGTIPRKEYLCAVR
jgi:hypothetical protein